MLIALKILGDVTAVAGLMGLVYLVLANVAVFRFAWSRPKAAVDTPPVTLLKPVCGADPGLYENLVSFCRQDYPGPVQIVIGAHRESDPAVAIARRVIADLPDADITLVIDAALTGWNFKVCNLANMLPSAKHDVFVIADSDMRVGPDYLGTVAASLLQPGVGIATTLYKARPVGGMASRLGCGFINYGFLPSVLVGRLLRAAPFCSGSTIAIRRNTLAAIGGLAALQNHLADDYVIGALVRGLGQSVALSRYVVENIVKEAGFIALFRHELRWQRTIRGITPLGLAASVITNPVALALIALPLSGGAPLEWLLLATTLVARITLVYMCDRVFSLEPMGLWLAVPREILSQIVLFAAFCGQRVSWRDATFQVNRSGELTLEGDELV